jgi:hypothetical protein
MAKLTHLACNNLNNIMRCSCGSVPVICTGFETTGYCFWCGGSFPDNRHRHYCSTTCSDEYHRHFRWSAASRYALIRSDYHCQICNLKSEGMYGLEVHHIVPVNGGYRVVNALNCPCNLIVLCKTCHDAWHLKQNKIDKRGFLVPNASELQSAFRGIL